MFGLGGIMVELMKDVAFRIVPVEARDARAIIRDIKGYPLLEGLRGEAGVSIATLEPSSSKLTVPRRTPRSRRST